uniref:GIPC PDZ domain containing family member 3 n=1 Tax=Nomascus leucogenys TaxID=61853 RepID=A0A2I3HCB5_NOMLE
LRLRVGTAMASPPSMFPSSLKSSWTKTKVSGASALAEDERGLRGAERGTAEAHAEHEQRARASGAGAGAGGAEDAGAAAAAPGRAPGAHRQLRLTAGAGHGRNAHAGHSGLLHGPAARSYRARPRPAREAHRPHQGNPGPGRQRAPVRSGRAHDAEEKLWARPCPTPPRGREPGGPRFGAWSHPKKHSLRDTPRRIAQPRVPLLGGQPRATLTKPTPSTRQDPPNYSLRGAVP